MDKQRPLKILAIALCLTLAAVGCSRKSKEADGASAFANEAGILKYIPADAPYAFAAAAKLPEDVKDKIMPVYSDVFLKMMRESMAGAMDDYAKKMQAVGGDGSTTEKSQAFEKALAELLTPEVLENTGISANPIAAIYGVGMIPVVRIELDDKKKLENTIARLEDKAGEKMATGAVGGQAYRYAGDEQARILLATVGDYMVMTIVPIGLSEDSLKAVLGIDLPLQNIAAAGSLSKLAADYAFSPYMAGYLDIERITATFLDAPSGINSELLSMMEYDASALSDVCKSEIRDMSRVMPRFVAGYNEMSTERMTTKAVFELRDDISAGLSTLSAPVPGLGKDHGGLVSFGVGMDLLAARKFYEARLDAMDANPYKCELLAELQAGVQGGRAALDAPMPPIVYGITGFLAVVDGVEGMDLATQQPPTEIDMSLLIATDNAAGLIGMASLFSPELAALDLKPNGKPVEAPLPPMGQPFPSALVAMNDAAIGAAVGKDAGDRISALIASPPSDVPPFMSMHMDMKRYYEFAGNMLKMSAGMDPQQGVSPESMETIGEAMMQFSELFDRMSYDVAFTENGVELASSITFAD